MDNQKNYVLIGSIALFVFFSAILIFVSITNSRSPSKLVVTTDPDTGEVLYDEPNKIPEAASQFDVILLGSGVLLDNGLTTDQFFVAKGAIIDYVKNTYGETYKVVKILPNTFVFEDKVMSFDIKLGETENRLFGKVTVPTIYSIKTVIRNAEGNIVLDTGVVDISDRYTGDGIPPEEHSNDR